MLHMTLADAHIVENFEAARSLQRLGVPDEVINEMYERQLAKDKENDYEDAANR